jgi:hypothetical protein
VLDFTGFALGFYSGNNEDATIGTEAHRFMNEGKGKPVQDFLNSARPQKSGPSVSGRIGRPGNRFFPGDTEESAASDDPLIGRGTGIHGTPTRILDKLEQAESRGRDIEGPPIPGMKQRAQGPYQFLPSTQKMLTDKYGYKPFNVHDRAESRDAADFYLQQLAREQGGMAGALAAYHGERGFEGKPQSSYVSGILDGSSPERQYAGNKSASTSSSQTTIQGPFTVNIKGDDGARIARELESELSHYAYANQANAGLR